MENNSTVVVLSVTVIVIVFSYVLYKQMGGEKATDSTGDKKTEKAGNKVDTKKEAPNVSYSAVQPSVIFDCNL